MTNRNLKFYGIAYGDTPVSLDVIIDGQQVFSNTVSTTPGDLPLDVNSIVCDQVLFEVDGTELFPITFSGSLDHSITVTGGSGVLLGPVLSNYMNFYVGNTVLSGTATSFVSVYSGTPANSENTPDVRSNVYINGVQQVPPCEISQGTWTWPVPTSSNLSCHLNIALGNVAA
jgi:hypothetical protein